MPSPVEVAVVRTPDLVIGTLPSVVIAAGQAVGLSAGSQIIGKVLAAEAKVTASVPVGQSNTPLIDVRGYTRAALWIPATFDGSVISVWVSHDGVNVQPLYDITNTPVQVGSGVVAASRAYDLPGELAPWPYILLACATVQATTTTDFVLVLRTD